MRLSFYILINIFALIFSSYSLTGQSCGTDKVHQELMKNDPVYRNNYIQSNNRVHKIIDQNLDIKTRNGDNEIYTIPVVVHIIHAGEPLGDGANITDFEVLSAIQGLNDKYSNKIGAGLDIEIRFCLATTDPDGCPTTGIVRVDGSVYPKYKKNGVAYSDTLGVPDTDVKDLSKWPVDRYYNIWVVNEISPGGIAGYAYYPNGNPYDGTIVMAAYFKYTDNTLAHELGHGLFIKHTFDGANGDICPDNTDCKFDGDEICDTPPHRQDDCGDDNPCGLFNNWSNSRFNYMSYCFPSESLARFTPNQKARMRAVMLDDIRNPLLHSNGCMPSTFNTIVSKSDVSCVGECNGSINLDPTCPSTYRFKWSTGDTTKVLNNICAGMYTVTVTNSIKLSTVINVEITENPLPVVDAGADVNITQGNSIKIGGAPTAKGKAPFKYQWLPVDGLNSSTVPNPLASPANTTKYYIEVTDANGCISYDSVIVNVITTKTGEENDLSNLKVFPNPTKDILKLEFINISNGDYKVRIKNVMGQEVYNEPVSINNNTLHKEISLAHLPAAFYILEIANGNTLMTTKVQKID